MNECTVRDTSKRISMLVSQLFPVCSEPTGIDLGTDGKDMSLSVLWEYSVFGGAAVSELICSLPTLKPKLRPLVNP